jgi:hypothetical protein
MRRSNERGVAMPTVLFIGAVLTAVASISIYAAISELRTGDQDRRSAQAFALAENGIPRLMLELKGSGSLTWGDIRTAGCGAPPIEVTTTRFNSDEFFDVQFSVYDPESAETDRLPKAPWSAAARPCVHGPTSGVPVAWPTIPSISQPSYFAITAEGRKGGVPSGAAETSRHILQVIKITRVALPFGVFAENVSISGSPKFQDISLLTTGDVSGREKIGFRGSDRIYKKADFWPSLSAAEAAPASAHALGGLYLRSKGMPEHPPALDCDADSRLVPPPPSPTPPHEISAWDQSGRGDTITDPACPGGGTVPPTSYFATSDLKRIAPEKNLSNQTYVALKRAAIENGIYCTGAAGVLTSCSAGSPTSSWGPPLLNTVNSTLVPAAVTSNGNYVAYFDFTGQVLANVVTWSGSFGSCISNESVTIVVRNGGVKLTDATINGAVIAPEGVVQDSGTTDLTGVVLAKGLESYSTTTESGHATYEMQDCWLTNMPVAFLKIEYGSFTERD